MTDVYLIEGSSIWIGGPIDIPNGRDMIDADFADVFWTEISGWQTSGTLGDTAASTTTVMMGTGRDRKSKGSRNAGTMENTFVPDIDDLGQRKLYEAAASSCGSFAFRIAFSAGCDIASEVTISVAAPAVVTWANHGLDNGSIVYFDAATLPTGLFPDVPYYVVARTDNTFSVSTDLGGAPVATLAAGVGPIVAGATPAPRVRMFAGTVTRITDQNGDMAAVQMITTAIEINSNIVRATGMPATLWSPHMLFVDGQSGYWPNGYSPNA